ncbi:type II secretion system secretin GspD [Sulfitobacter sp. D35]|uniref:type II secretion system secretin GspD n=1 Tax=Sulfitobacter sp. D35 TaxID=3083252 RepID=UPI00296FFE37|nr:type II secretion system secretin GspD [Sulfitobacter sp. D35]
MRAQAGLDLRNVDLEGFVRIVAEETGRAFVLDPSVTGRVNVVAPQNVSSQALFEIFLNVLELNGLTIVSGIDADRIVPINDASGLAGRARTTGGFETRVIQLRNADVNEVASVIRPILPSEAVLSVVEGSQLLIISDRAQNFSKIQGVISSLDRSNGDAVETIRVRNGNAGDIAQTVLNLDLAPAGATISADGRANTVVVSGPITFRNRVRQLVDELDTPQRSIATRVVRLAYADATQLADVISRSFGNLASEGDEAQPQAVTIVADTQTNSLIVSAPTDRVGPIVQSIQALDFRPSQVLIEGLIFELSVQNFAELSVQFAAVLNDAVAGGAQFSFDGRQTLSGVLSSVSRKNVPDLGSGGFFGAKATSGDDSFVGFLTALSRQSTTRVLSTPSILTLNNQEAEIVVAQNVPFVTGSFSTVGDSAVPNQPFQTIDRQDVGLTLRVVPQITIDGTIRLAINQEVSNLTNSTSDAGGEITSKRSIRTNVIVNDERVIMLGGLIEDGNGSVGQRVPGASDLPLVGNLFRGRSARSDQRVLLVMLRPHIISNDAEATRLSRKAARDARRASDLIQPLSDGKYPAVPDGRFPYDGANLNQPFDAGFIDSVARERQFPALPTPLRFGEGRIE